MVVVTLNELNNIKKLTERLNNLAESITKEDNSDNLLTLKFNVAVTFAELDKLFKELPLKCNWHDDNI